MTKSTKAKQFDKITIQRLLERDGGCIFCKINYHMNSSQSLAYKVFDPMHIVNKSQGGLGIEENGVIGCRYHHSHLDNGNSSLREEMQQYIESYMKELYPGWDKEDLVYKK